MQYEPGWLSALKLYFQILVRRIEVCYFRFQLHHLTIESTELLAKKIDVDALNRRRSVLDNELLDQVERGKVNGHGGYNVLSKRHHARLGFDRSWGVLALGSTWCPWL